MNIYCDIAGDKAGNMAGDLTGDIIILVEDAWRARAPHMPLIEGVLRAGIDFFENRGCAARGGRIL